MCFTYTRICNVFQIHNLRIYIIPLTVLADSALGHEHVVLVAQVLPDGHAPCRRAVLAEATRHALLIPVCLYLAKTRVLL